MPIDKMPDRHDPRDSSRRRGRRRRTPEFRSPAGIRSIRPSRFTVSPSSASSRARRFGAIADARPGDALILTKPIGVGIYSAAIKKGALSDEGYREMLGFMTRLNRVGAELAKDARVHAMTDVTGFGLLGHALEMARGAGVTVRLRFDDTPRLTQAESLVQAGYSTGASHRNWASYADAVVLPEGFQDWRRRLLTDPQTSGGLLVACDAEAAPALCARIRQGATPGPRSSAASSAARPVVRVEQEPVVA